MAKKIKEEELRKEIIDFFDWFKRIHANIKVDSKYITDQYVKNQLWRNRSF